MHAQFSGSKDGKRSMIGIDPTIIGTKHPAIFTPCSAPCLWTQRGGCWHRLAKTTSDVGYKHPSEIGPHGTKISVFGLKTERGGGIRTPGIAE